MRLIDADALPISFDGHTVSVWKKDLDNAPTIDPEDLRPKGEWVERHLIVFDDELTAYRCSNCNLTDESKSMFCPNCGADMRGEKKCD